MSIAHLSSLLLLAPLSAGGMFTAAAPGPEEWTVPHHAVELKNPLAGDAAEILAKGKNLYRDRCADCHGSKGKGNGQAAADLSRKPTDLNSAAVTQQKDGELFWKITEGRRPMPGFRAKLSEEQRWQLVSYLRTLSGKDPRDGKPKDSKPTNPKP